MDDDLSSEHLAELVEAAEEAYTRAAEREPSAGDWGLEFIDDPSFVLAQTYHGFVWFETRDDLLDYVAGPMALTGSLRIREENLPEVREAMSALARQARETGRPIAAGEFLETDSGKLELTWMGKLDDLLSSPSEFEAGQRREFRSGRLDDGDEDDEALGRPIDPDEVADFLEFLMTFRG